MPDSFSPRRGTGMGWVLFRGFPAPMLLLGLLSAAACSQAAGNVVQVNLGSFSGDSQLAPVVAETLLTDLAKSSRIAVLNGPGRGGHGGYVLTGSCRVYDGAVAINARLMDPATGRTLPGVAGSVEGPKAQVFTLAHSLAGKLTARMTGGAETTGSTRKPGVATPSPGIKPGLGIASLPHVSASVRLGGSRAATNPSAQAKRRVVTAATRPAPPSVPIAAPRATSDPADLIETVSSDGYTGLIIDARGLDLNRSMSPAIRRRDGTVVWNGGEASPDYVISEGIVTYAATMQQALDQQRAGARPLVVKAVARHETPFPSDPYIDDADAESLLKAAQRDTFLKKYRVIFVIGRLEP